MRRLVVFATLSTSMLIATTGAQAKAPPSGFEVCGAQACIAISAFGDAEPLAIGLWYGGDDGAAGPSASLPPAPFYALHWAFRPGDVHTGYYVPTLNLFRYVGDPASPPTSSNRMIHWNKLGEKTRPVLERLTATLEPFSSPVLSRVTVGGKAVRDPESYMRLWSVAGRPTYAWPLAGFLRIKMTCNVASPWTDAAAGLRISRRGAYLLRDATVLRISGRLARQVRARKSLR